MCLKLPIWVLPFKSTAMIKSPKASIIMLGRHCTCPHKPLDSKAIPKKATSGLSESCFLNYFLEDLPLMVNRKQDCSQISCTQAYKSHPTLQFQTKPKISLEDVSKSMTKKDGWYWKWSIIRFWIAPKNVCQCQWNQLSIQKSKDRKAKK